MNGLLRRLTRRRAATADETPPTSPAASEPVDATVVSLEEQSPLSEEERAREEELRRRRRDLPAGVDPERLEGGAGEGARRGATRRRVRYLRATREVLLRDLGGFYFEVHRAAGSPQAGHRDILETKAGRLAAIDAELRALEASLGVSRAAETVVREPGVGGACPACGELHGSDAGWCAHCGTPLSERSRKRTEEQVAQAIAQREAHAAEQARQAQQAEQERQAQAQAQAQAEEQRTAEQVPTSLDAPATGANGSAAADAPTSDLGEPVTSPPEHRP